MVLVALLLVLVVLAIVCAEAPSFSWPRVFDAYKPTAALAPDFRFSPVLDWDASVLSGQWLDGGQWWWRLHQTQRRPKTACVRACYRFDR